MAGTACSAGTSCDGSLAWLKQHDATATAPASALASTTATGVARAVTAPPGERTATGTAGAAPLRHAASCAASVAPARAAPGRPAFSHASLHNEYHWRALLAALSSGSPSESPVAMAAAGSGALPDAAAARGHRLGPRDRRDDRGAPAGWEERPRGVTARTLALCCATTPKKFSAAAVPRNTRCAKQLGDQPINN